MKKAVLYIRVNKGTAKAKDELQKLEHQLRDYCTLYNYKVVKVFSDVANGNVMNRKGLNELLKDISERNTLAEILVIKNYSTLSTVVDSLNSLIILFNKKDIEVNTLFRAKKQRHLPLWQYVHLLDPPLTKFKPKKKSAILYAYGHEDKTLQDKENSTESQIKRLKTYCKENDLRIIKTVSDKVTRLPSDKVNFKSLMSSILNGEIKADYLLFLRWDRISRNATEVKFIMEQLQNKGITPMGIEISTRMQELLDTNQKASTIQKANNSKKSQK
jgi:DNA invertase Pin-like site-specific DNA recombinase